MTKKFFTYTALLLLLGLGGCAGAPASETVSPENDTALETYNRAMFSFNNKLDKFVIRPVAKGYRAVTNEYFRQRVTNFFSNIDEPISAANHMLQGEFSDSGNNLGRFVINTTFGLVGLYDVASSMGMEKDKTGFDETLATWCVPDGPFIVLPVVGPSTPRAAVGFTVDGYSSPGYWIAQESGGEDAWLVYYTASGLKYLNLMAENLKFLESLEEGSIDYYEAVKSAYLQNRGKIKACGRNEENSVPDYDFDMGEMNDDF